MKSSETRSCSARGTRCRSGGPGWITEEWPGGPAGSAPVSCRQAPDGEWLQTRISEAYTEWTVKSGEFEGRVGYGMSEYLDQIIDGQPVGIDE